MTTRQTKILIITSLALSSMAFARRGGGDDTPIRSTTARLETINCALYFGNDPAPQGVGQALVENSSALIKNRANGIEYLFSVRGKTAVAKLSFPATKQVLTAQGAIEMLRHGGRADGQRLLGSEGFLRGGNEDNQDGKPEKEAGFELSIASETGAVKLKCLSTNGVKK
jgi:hypothetical protein